MNYHWKELVPIDRYVVRSNGMLHDYDRKILTLLYQPLVGAKAYSLYMSLWSELEENRLSAEESTHHSLMAIMQLPLNEIYQERLKLEGMGLLNTYQMDAEDPKKFIYELQPPLSPKWFFSDGMLNVYLYNRVGKRRYQQLKEFFSDNQMPNNVKDITKDFNEVFQSILMSELKTIPEDDESILTKELINRSDGKSVIVHDETFDFQLFLAGLSENLVPKKAITPAVKEAIKKLAYIYGISPIDMKNVVLDAVDERDEINIEQLRKSARDWYQFECGEDLPALMEKVQPLPYRLKKNEVLDVKDRELIEKLESLTPRQFLIDISGGIEPSQSDLKIIEEVMFKFQLLPGVVNVLIYYVMLKTDMKLSKAYVEKIASHWGRKGVKTVKDAMELAKKEHRQYQEWAEPKPKQKKRRQIVRKEKLPSWLKNEEIVEEHNLEDESFELERKKLEARIRKFKKKPKS
ncbi:replication initiation and membrane attachment family protein [Bacillus sp. FJAT-47783]|uniref:replication initiation and membrane attachment family protein n=1 Tax=Bacillus sp. FJAT-47783 TaxID=2922712 RepID=UPI001FAB6E77|nr:replication initiation and membrane attachment family protein [Bacillus sp. FJAT-47783]